MDSEYPYHTLFESAPVGIGLATIDGQVLKFNKEMIRLLGVGLEQMNARQFYSHPEERELFLRRLHGDSFVRDFEMELRRTDGEIFYGMVNARLIESAGQNIVLTAIVDITAHKRYEDRLRHCNEELAELVGEEYPKDWRESPEGIEEIPDMASQGLPLPTVDTFLDLTFQNTVLALLDMKHLTESLVTDNKHDETPQLCHLFNCPRLNELTDALIDAIYTLQKTKSAFRSRELGRLRQKLEKIVRNR